MPVPLPYDPVYDAIVAFLGDGKPENGGIWDFSVAPLVYENSADGAPVGVPAPWIAVILDSELYGQQSIGGGKDAGDNRWDEDGTLWFHVFVPRGTGAREARRIAKGLANLFRGETLLDGAIEFGDANLGAGDPGVKNGNYYLLSVSLDWRYVDAQ